jgi:hypothetical protein
MINKFKSLKQLKEHIEDRDPHRCYDIVSGRLLIKIDHQYPIWISHIHDSSLIYIKI